MLVQDYLQSSARRLPDKVALKCKGQQLTYQEIDAQANRLANLLVHSGVRRGDRVAILLENSVESVIAIFATLKAGGIFIVLHHGTKPDRLALLLDDATPAALVTANQHVGDSIKVLANASSLGCVVWADSLTPKAFDGPATSTHWADLKNYSDVCPLSSTIDLDLAALIYTSGSTGIPKAVMITHGNMMAATNSVNAYLQNRADDVILSVLPLAFSYGLYQILLAFQVGATVVLEQSFAFPAHIISVIEKEGVTALPGVPTLFAMLLKFPKLLAREFPSLRYLTNAGAALSVSQLAQIRETFPKAQIFSMYGLTECKRVCYLPPEEVERRPSSVGIAIPNTEVFIVDEDGERLGPDQVGELVVRGAHVTRGYWRSPELTALRFKPGQLPGETLLYTGDLFRMDEDGFLYFVSRKDDVIKSRGEKVSPREIESVICQLPEVALAVAVGVPDEVLGQAILVAVELHEGATLSAQAISAHCMRNLLSFMVPKYVQIVDELPRTSNGKLDKKELVRRTPDVWNCRNIQANQAGRPDLPQY